jgi:hypothetical protein
MDKQLQPWHIYTAIFVAFWTLSAYFDNFFMTAILCVAGGFGSDTFRRYLADGFDEKTDKSDRKFDEKNEKVVRDVDDAPTKPLPPEPEFEQESKPTQVPIQ